jgi:hypothetical protein
MGLQFSVSNMNMGCGSRGCQEQAISLQGAVTLPRALIAARTGDPAATDEQPGWARHIAVRLAADGTVTRASAPRW